MGDCINPPTQHPTERFSFSDLTGRDDNSIVLTRLVIVRLVKGEFVKGNIMQKFIAREKREFSNGAIGYAPGGPFDCLGPYAKVLNCPIAGTELRRTAYATGYADTFFSIPACTRVKGKYIGGYFTSDDNGGIEFRPLTKYTDRLK